MPQDTHAEVGARDKIRSVKIVRFRRREVAAIERQFHLPERVVAMRVQVVQSACFRQRALLGFGEFRAQIEIRSGRKRRALPLRQQLQPMLATLRVRIRPATRSRLPRRGR